MARAARRLPPERHPLTLAEFRLGIRLAREDLAALAERLDDSPAWLDGDASTEWKLAADLHATAQRALREVASLADVLAVHSTLVQARFRLARAEALGYDEDPPTTADPCWFDARHGPGTTEVDWPSAGRVRACREDADRVATGLAPRRRLLALTTATDPSPTSAWQRLMAAHARGSGYALGALYAGRPDGLIV